MPGYMSDDLDRARRDTKIRLKLAPSDRISKKTYERRMAARKYPELPDVPDRFKAMDRGELRKQPLLTALSEAKWKDPFTAVLIKSYFNK